MFGKDLRRLLFAAWVPLIFFVVRVIDTFLFDVLVSRRKNVIAPQILREMFALGLYFLLFAGTIKWVFHTSITAWLATTTVLAAVIGLGLQDTLGNLFAGVSIHLEEAFEAGDVIHSGDYFGVVEGVTWRATRIRTFNNDVVFLPNSQLAKDRIQVFPRNNLNGRVVPFGVDHHVAPAVVIDVLTQAASHVEGVARDMPVIARIGGFGESSVTYEVKYFTRDYSMRDRIDAEIRKAAWYAFRRNDIHFATPVRAYAAYTPPAATTHNVAPAEVKQRLSDVSIFSPLSDEALTALAAAARIHFYSKGETIIRHGDAGDSMFVVHNGTVSVRIHDDATSAFHEVAELGPGKIFGEMALLTGETRTADVVAVSDVTAFEIVKESLQPILRDTPQLADAMAAKVMQRRDALDSIRSASTEEEESTLLSRIRSYFGL